MIKAEEKQLLRDINKNRKTGKVAEAVLQTDDRVLARITDGIYRQPASALRELISNAYDADATQVHIHTDAPRFDSIVIRDNGSGMDDRALARMIHHIGGSSKRRDEGEEFNTTNKKDSSRSPKGRRLIGKIGVGLFSVSQLTRHFQIITKVKGQDYRLIAEVILKTYSEDEKDRPKKDTVVTGRVRVLSVPAEDKQSHGTEITLLDLRPQARNLLTSKETWDLILDSSAEAAKKHKPPAYHTGYIRQGESAFTVSPQLPWSTEDASEDRFMKLYEGVLKQVGKLESTPSLENTLDNYLSMLWTLSLSVPCHYLNDHPFDLTRQSEPALYRLPDTGNGKLTKLQLPNGKRVRDELGLVAPELGNSPPFEVFIDGIKLRRPIRFSKLPVTGQALKKPMMFYGKAQPDLSSIDREERGGDLSFEAYFLWTPKVVPKENNGLLIRISDASGTLFDSSFARYQVAETYRLPQITAELFVHHGLDAALNIDRESFNSAHPHYQYIQRWVHRALRQIATFLKGEAKSVRDVNLRKTRTQQTNAVERLVAAEVARIDDDSEPTDIRFVPADSVEQERNEGGTALREDEVFGTDGSNDDPLLRTRIRAVAQILDAYGLLSKLKYDKQEALLRAIVNVFTVEEGK